MKTIIYGGAFNPPTVAHLAILDSLLEVAANWDAEVWLLPSGNRRDKTIPTDIDVRLAYLEALRNSSINPDRVKIETYELSLDENVETYDTMELFNVQHPDHDFFWVFGVDSLNTLPDWKEGQWIMDNTNVIAVKRKNYELTVEIKSLHMVDIAYYNVSSTQVRLALSTNEPVAELVPALVLEILNSNK